ncbi:Innexin inx2, partial [Cichlidogyrus casuarinus]
GKRARMADRAYRACGMCVISKRLGTCLVLSYLIIKVITILNAAMQIYLIQRFLGFYEGGSYSKASMQLGSARKDGEKEVIPYGEDDTSGFGFGLTVANYIRSGRDWPETLIFPRVAYCRVPGIRLVGGDNAYTAQCALPINMLNEKIYIFLWFWIVFVLCVCSASLILWISRLTLDPQRKNFIKRFLRARHIKNSKGEVMGIHDVDQFVDDYLRRDGVFLLRMMSINAGEVITAEIVQKLYKDWDCEHASPEESLLSPGNSLEKAKLGFDGEKHSPYQPQMV